MTGDFNIKIRQGNINQDSLQADGLKREFFQNNAEMISIFNAIDDGNGILDNNEIAKINQMMQEAAAEDGNATELSDEEGKSLLNKLGLSNLNMDSLVNFLGLAINVKPNSNVKVTYNNDKSRSETMDGITWEFDKDGKWTKYIGSDGRITEFIYNNDGTVTHKNNDGSEMLIKDNKVISGKNEDGSFKIEYTSNGGRTETYTDGKLEGVTFILDQDGKCIGRTNPNGTEIKFTNEEDGSYTAKDINSGLETHYKRNADGSQTATDSYGRISNYDENGKWIGGSDKYGTYEVKYNNDGTSTQTYTDGTQKGTIFYFDANGKCIRRVNPDNTSFKFINNKNGDYTSINEQTNEQTNWKFSKDGTFSSVLANGDITVHSYEVSYNESTMSDGSTIYQNNNGSYAIRTRKGEIKTTCRRNETFDDTMKRLGITSEKDQAIFKAANKKAVKRGRFIYGANDIIIPKSIAGKIKMTNVMKPQMGL